MCYEVDRKTSAATWSRAAVDRAAEFCYQFFDNCQANSQMSLILICDSSPEELSCQDRGDTGAIVLDGDADSFGARFSVMVD